MLFTEALADLRTVGALVGSSRFLARAMAPRIAHSDPPKVIVELGVGTGNITREIIKRLRPQDLFVGIDANEEFVTICRQNIAPFVGKRRVHIAHGFAQDIDRMLKKHGAYEADEIICTLPFRVLPKKDTAAILKKVRSIIKSGGHFTFIRYVLAAPNKNVFDALDGFAVIKRTFVARNFPPAEVVKMRKT
ncbi:methyltransferase domain-containing protein [Candidatus Azambacteria bacterium]|nr:methyltransferase domain-containing protein [Candidatus Azambacteria bacterium]